MTSGAPKAKANTLGENEEERDLFNDSSDEENEEERLEREVERDFFDSSGRNLLDAPSGKKRSKKRCAWREIQREMFGTSSDSDDEFESDDDDILFNSK